MLEINVLNTDLKLPQNKEEVVVERDTEQVFERGFVPLLAQRNKRKIFCHL